MNRQPSLTEIVQGMKKRAPWRVASKMLKSAGLPRGRGWDDTLAAISKKAEKIPKESYEAIRSSYIEHLVCGEKSTRLYSIDPKIIGKLREKIPNMVVEKSIFSEAYPIPLSDQVLGKQDAILCVLSSIEEFSNGWALVYNSISTVKIRENFHSSDISEEAREILGIGNDASIRVESPSKVQTFDVVWISKNEDLIEVRVDTPADTRREDLDFLHMNMSGKIGEMICENEKIIPKNMFPIIQSMYEEEMDGIVVELAFVTMTDSSKHELMRGRDKCLRDELYHKGGKSAVGNSIDPYRIGIRWFRTTDGDLSSTPELTIEGSIRLLHQPQPFVSTVTIRKCTSISDYDYVRERVWNYLSS